MLLALLALSPAALAFAQDTRTSQETPSGDTRRDEEVSSNSWEYTPEQDQAIKRGLEYLASRQHSNGCWDSQRLGQWNVAVTALAGLAFLAHGDQPGRTAYGNVIEKALNWIIKIQWSDNHPSGHPGLFYDNDDLANEQADKPMHGHGYALLFLAEAYGQTHEPELRKKIHDALVRGVKLTEGTQSRDGGWFYKPSDRNKDEGSVTITQIQGLRAARNAGVNVSKSTIDRAVDYIRRSQIKAGDRAGGVRYTVHWGDPSPALTAAGIAVYYGAGEYGSPGIERGFEYLSRNMRFEDRTHFWNYTHLYAVQAMYQRGMPEWRDYYVKLRQNLLRSNGRNSSGAWDDGFAGHNFGTAVAVLCLEIPLGYLPIFQR